MILVNSFVSNLPYILLILLTYLSVCVKSEGYLDLSNENSNEFSERRSEERSNERSNEESSNERSDERSDERSEDIRKTSPSNFHKNPFHVKFFPHPHNPMSQVQNLHQQQMNSFLSHPLATHLQHPSLFVQQQKHPSFAQQQQILPSREQQHHYPLLIQQNHPSLAQQQHNPSLDMQQLYPLFIQQNHPSLAQQQHNPSLDMQQHYPLLIQQNYPSNVQQQHQQLFYPGITPSRIQHESPNEATQAYLPFVAIPWHPMFPYWGHAIAGIQDVRSPQTPGSLNLRVQQPKCRFYHQSGDWVDKNECSRRGGTPKSYSGSHTVCCLFMLTCGNSTDAYTSYFRNPKYPLSDTLKTPCQIRVTKADENTCGLRVQLKTFELPAGTGYCDGIALSVFGVPGKNYEPLCGTLKEIIYDIPIGDSSNPIYFEMAAISWLKMRWEVYITQISCSEYTTSTWPEVNAGETQPQGPPIPPSMSPGELGIIYPPGISGAPGLMPSSHGSVVNDQPTERCGLLGTRWQKPGFPFRNYGQLPPAKPVLKAGYSCINPEEGNLCQKLDPNLLLSDEEEDWGVPVLNNSRLYQYSGQELVTSDRIAFGRPTEPHEFPWVVAMYAGKKFHCGASLISERHVLTAAHCVIKQKPSAFKLSIGDWDINSQTDGSNVEGEIEKFVTHPGYSTVTLKYDAAVITLKNKVHISDSLRPICLPAYDISLVDNLATVTGWGRNEKRKLQPKMMKHSAHIVSNNICNQRWAEKGAPADIIADTMMCMDSQDGDSCKGDSGGPATMEFPQGSGQHIQVGIVSFGSASCTDKRLPGVYTNVGKLMDWIRKQMV